MIRFPRPTARVRRVAALALVLGPALVATQQPAARIAQAQREIWTRQALVLDSSELDLRIPIDGEPEEVLGVTRQTSNALVVATARLEPLEELSWAGQAFSSGRYDLRIEDRRGNCLLVHETVRVDTVLVRLTRTTEPCRALYMADVVRRSRRLARLPVSAGQLSDNWSVAPAMTAHADVYADSVVIVTTSLDLQANLPGGDSTIRVDSIIVGLALAGQRSWHLARTSSAVTADTTMRRGQTWSRKQLRFTIPIDSAFDLARSWPVVQVSLGVPKTESNPYGRAWTYAHAPQNFFQGMTRSGDRRP
jgi:hypothetical protein